ncbi:hypothetical protein J4Q44_G00362310 [Coregonus suidteri]|uniref:Uncharacterized protein n=1 Tax=Coregonus suidteri TaxID=861788 RepID=A0AAN8KXL1_9TELE
MGWRRWEERERRRGAPGEGGGGRRGRGDGVLQGREDSGKKPKKASYFLPFHLRKKFVFSWTSNLSQLQIVTACVSSTVREAVVVLGLWGLFSQPPPLVPSQHQERDLRL